MERRGTGLKSFAIASLSVCVLVAFFLGGCAPSATDEAEGNAPSGKEEVPTTARIVCDRDDTRVLTPRVAARPDGVHYTIDNRLGGDYGYSVEFPEGGGFGGDSAPKGESEHVGNFPPGEVRIGCYESNKDVKPDDAPLKVLEGDSGYRPVKLECEGGTSVTASSDYVAGTEGQDFDPVKQTRRMFSNQLEESDIVEFGGYPENTGTVRVVRDGRVVATVEYSRARGGWLQDSYTACQKF